MRELLYQSLDLVVHFDEVLGLDIFIDFEDKTTVTYREKSKWSFAIIENNYLKHDCKVLYMHPSIKEQMEMA